MHWRKQPGKDAMSGQKREKKIPLNCNFIRNSPVAPAKRVALSPNATPFVLTLQARLKSSSADFCLFVNKVEKSLSA